MPVKRQQLKELFPNRKDDELVRAAHLQVLLERGAAEVEHGTA